MSPRWLHWPAAALSTPTYAVSGDLVASTADRWNATNLVESGSAGDFTLFGSQPIRRPGSQLFIQVLMEINGWADYTTMISSVTFTDMNLYANGSLFAKTGFTVAPVSTLASFQFDASSATVNAFWSTLNAGDPFSVELFYG